MKSFRQHITEADAAAAFYNDLAKFEKLVSTTNDAMTRGNIPMAHTLLKSLKILSARHPDVRAMRFEIDKIESQMAQWN